MRDNFIYIYDYTSQYTGRVATNNILNKSFYKELYMTHMSNTIKCPEGWGNDSLSRFKEIAFTNEMSSFVHEKKWQDIIIKLSEILEKCSKHAMGEIGKNENEGVAYMLFMAAHNNYLALTRCSAAGHCLPSYPIGRASIEFAMYGWYLSAFPDAIAKWHDKPDANNYKSPKEYKSDLQKWNSEFQFSKINLKLKEEVEELHDWAKFLYQNAIDLGGHPNTDSIYTSIGVEKNLLSVNYLHAWDDLLQLTMKFTIEVGLFVISMFAISFRMADTDLNLTEYATVLAEELKILINK